MAGLKAISPKRPSRKIYYTIMTVRSRNKLSIHLRNVWNADLTQVRVKYERE